jgi:zona occludens toxin
MSLTIITGVPGSGKSLFTVWDFIRPLAGTKTTATANSGETVEIERTIYTNINGLLLQHELIEVGGIWTYDTGTKSWKYDGNGEGVRNWHNWAKPGSLIVFDEFQKVWPPRPAGAHIPPDVQTMDTHRHMGVDFILVCQNLNNVDRHLLGLCDRHIHIRRFANSPLCVHYEWDHANRSLQYKNALSKTPRRFPKAAYKLYKSAELHTKQKRKIPAALVVVVLALTITAAFGFNVKERMAERFGLATPTPGEAKDTGGVLTEYRDGLKVTASATRHHWPLPPLHL